MIKQFMLRLIGRVLSWSIVANWIIYRSMETPYFPIYKNGELYMDRFWLFNSYQQGPDKQEQSKYPWFPWNIRVHHIALPDQDCHLHDHPWNARTFILKGWYVEQRLADEYPDWMQAAKFIEFTRHRGDTAKLGYGEYHRITRLAPGGAWTLFISGPYQGTWGFLVEGVKVKWRTYLGFD